MIIYWNKKEFEAFPKDIQDAIREAAIQGGRFEKALCRAGIDGNTSLDILKNEFNYSIKIPDPVKYLEGKGMTVTNLTDEQRTAFIEATKPVRDKWIPKIGKEIYEQATADMAK